MKRTQLKRTEWNPQRRKIPARSKKRQVHMATERAPLVRSYVESGGTCEVCPLLRRAGIPTRCGPIGGMHERRKSSSGGSRVNRRNLLAACNWSNGFIEDEPELVRQELGPMLVLRERDAEWPEMSKRNDR